MIIIFFCCFLCCGPLELKVLKIVPELFVPDLTCPQCCILNQCSAFNYFYVFYDLLVELCNLNSINYILVPVSCIFIHCISTHIYATLSQINKNKYLQFETNSASNQIIKINKCIETIVFFFFLTLFIYKLCFYCLNLIISL